MAYNVVDEACDKVHFHEVRRIFGGNGVPEWVTEVLASVDHALPPQEIILASLDDQSRVVSSTPAVFRLPQSPSYEDLAKCILASRALLKCVPDLVYPMEWTEDDCVEDLVQASRLCATIGGEKAILTALVWAQDERTYA